MGLTIHYGLKLRTGRAERAAALLDQLRQKALDLPFEIVDPDITHLSPEICAPGLEHYRDSEGEEPETANHPRIFWLLVSCAGYGMRLPWQNKDELGPSVDPVEALAFNTWPGPGSESAVFGLARYPAEIDVVYKPKNDDRFRTERQDGYFRSREFDLEKWRRHVSRLQKQAKTDATVVVPALDDYSQETTRKVPTRMGRGWRFRSFCKTQYASDPQHGGIANFLRCHLSVIRLLEHAEELGFEVDVRDEGHFGPARYADDHEQARAEGREPTYLDHPASHDIKRLVKQCEDHNRLIAGFYGAFKDALGEATDMVSPISQYANFEHLEAEFHAAQGDRLDAFIKQMGAVAKKAAEEAKRKGEAGE